MVVQRHGVSYYVTEQDKLNFKEEDFVPAYAPRHWGLSWVAEDTAYKEGHSFDGIPFLGCWNS